MPIIAAAHLSRVFIAACDRCGTERGITWSDGSAIAGPDGWLLGGPALPDAPAVVRAECDLALADDKALSDRNHVVEDLRTDVCRDPVPTSDRAMTSVVFSAGDEPPMGVDMHAATEVCARRIRIEVAEAPPAPAAPASETA